MPQTSTALGKRVRYTKVYWCVAAVACAVELGISAVGARNELRAITNKNLVAQFADEARFRRDDLLGNVGLALTQEKQAGQLSEFGCYVDTNSGEVKDREPLSMSINKTAEGMSVSFSKSTAKGAIELQDDVQTAVVFSVPADYKFAKPEYELMLERKGNDYRVPALNEFAGKLTQGVLDADTERLNAPELAPTAVQKGAVYVIALRNWVCTSAFIIAAAAICTHSKRSKIELDAK